MINVLNSDRKREYMTGLMKKRSIIALCGGILELICVFFALLMGFNKMSLKYDTSVFWSYMYFTMITNTMAALSVAFIIPFAVEGIRKNRFILPKWVSILLFVSTNSISIVFLLVVTMIMHTSPEEAVGDGGIYAHFICPILVLILFFQIESGYRYNTRDRILASLPFAFYMLLYYVMVVVIGVENGGWKDIYHAMGYAPFFIAFPVMLAVSYATSLFISKLSNYLTRRRTEKMFCYWGENAEPVDALVEAYGLGIMTARNMDKENIEVPYDILEELAKRYNIAPSKMIRSFVKGLESGMK